MPEPPTYDIDELLQNSDSAINVLLKSWITELDNAYIKIQLTSYRYKLETAVGSDLDSIWGRIFEVKRRGGESDDDYRSRLIVHTRVMTGSGTAPNCESVINSLTGRPGGSIVESRWPGRALFLFRNMDDARAAKRIRDRLERIIPEMIAAGISWEMPFLFEDYDITGYFKKRVKKTFTIRAHMQQKRFDDYDLGAKIVLRRTLGYSLREYVLKRRSKTYKLDRGKISFKRSRQYTIRARLVKRRSVSYGIRGIFWKRCQKQYTVAAYLKTVHDRQYDFRTYMQRGRRGQYMLSAVISA